jgi:hypothetical protein
VIIFAVSDQFPSHLFYFLENNTSVKDTRCCALMPTFNERTNELGPKCRPESIGAEMPNRRRPKHRQHIPSFRHHVPTTKSRSSSSVLSSRFLGLTSPQPMSLGAVKRKKNQPTHWDARATWCWRDERIDQWLPNEIITQIIQASSASDQAALCRTSRLFHALGVPVLYRVVELLSKFLLYPSCEPFQICRTGMLI